jgi:hypothetical protein
MPVQQGSSPTVWNDAIGPAFGAGPGSAAPSYTVAFLADTGGGNEINLVTMTASTNDRVYTTIQLPHDLVIPSSGNIILKPHVHWTFNTAPGAGLTVVWELNYVLAKINAQFGAAVTPLTATAYTTTGSNEVRKHLVTSLGDITVAAANVGPSMMLVGNIKLKSTSTIGSSLVAMLSFDVHYQVGPRGTDSEFS